MGSRTVKIDKSPDLWEYENKWRALGKLRIAGTDEVGRGPLAGPVVAASVIFEPGVVIRGLNDSKKLTEKARNLIYEQIKEKCVCYSISSVSNEEIDRSNILRASLLAMKNSVESLSIAPDVVLIDGKFAFEGDFESEAIVKGDGKSFSIAAASILAKVYRDGLMAEYDGMYPQYGFARHKGYPTKLHYEAIAEHGVTPIHRKSFRLY